MSSAWDFFNPTIMCPTKFLVMSSGTATLASADSPWSGLVTPRLRGTWAWEASAKWGSISVALSQSLSSSRVRCLGSFSEQGLVIEVSDVFFPTVSKILGFQQTKYHTKYAGILSAVRMHYFRKYICFGHLGGTIFRCVPEDRENWALNICIAKDAGQTSVFVPGNVSWASCCSNK